MAFSKLKDTIRVKGTCDAWFGKCCLALERGGFVIFRDDRRQYTLDARYRGFTIDGAIHIILTPDGEKVEIAIEVSADCDHLFAWLGEPRERILNAFTTHLWDRRKS
jgi:hypothetical protein